MTSSELSNALNPHVVAHRHPRRNAAQNASASTTPVVPFPTPVVAPGLPQPTAPHRSELELAIALPPPPLVLPSPPLPLPPPPPAQVVSIPPQEQPQRNASTNPPPLVQEFYKLVSLARDATAAEKRRRVAWEQEQQSKSSLAQVEMKRQMLGMQQELSLLKAYVSMHPNMTPPSDEQLRDLTPQSMSPIFPSPPQPTQLPVFVQGSSSHTITAPQASSLHQSPFSGLYTLSPSQTPALPLDVAEGVGSLTPQSSGPLPTPPLSSPRPDPNSRKRPRHVQEDDSDYDCDTEDSASPPTDRPVKRKNGHGSRCLTIHHAMRIHIRKLMKLQHGEDLPDELFDGVTVGPDEPVRFVWHMTTKQSATNASMKKRVVNSLLESRNRYMRVPDKDFGKKNLGTVFEQAFTTLRQKYKAQKDATTASKLKRREDQKALKARRLHRKKAKLTNRTEAWKKLDAFSQPIFASALHQECMSSEESDEERVEGAGTGDAVLRTRGPSWRSARLLRFYSVLDEYDKFEKNTQPKRGVRRERREGAPKDGLFLPPKGVARWMVSQCWLEETMAMRPDLSDILREIIVNPSEPEKEMAYLMLGPETSDDAQDPTLSRPNVYAHISDTSYSLHNALQPIV